MAIRERRMLSNSISTSEKVNSLSDAAALIYTWNMSHLDDDGRGDRSIFYLKTKIVPGRDYTKDQIELLREEIIAKKLMIPYNVNGHEYWYMPPEIWEFHQRGSWQGKHRKPSSFPTPNTNNLKKQCSDTLKNGNNSVQSDNRREGKLRERKKRNTIVTSDFISELKNLPAYEGIDVDKELQKMDAWLLTPKGKGRKKTKRFIVNWLNRIDVEVKTPTQDWRN